MRRERSGNQWGARWFAFCLLTVLPALSGARDLLDDADGGWSTGPESQPPRRIQNDGTPIFRFTAPFDKAGFPVRAAWDVPVHADLRLASGLSLRMRCSDASAARQFTLYLKSGNGWYASHFMPEANGQWHTATLEKEHMDLEGTPAGWGQISQLRVAVWKAFPRRLAFDLAEISVRGANSPVLVVRGVSAGADAGKGWSADSVRYSANVVSSLRRRGIRPALVEQSDLTPSLFESIRLTILPYNPALSEDEAALLGHQLASGRPVIGFYTVPRMLQGVLGLHHKRHIRASQVPEGFSGFRANANTRHALPGLPDWIAQKSWMMQELKYSARDATPVAHWMDGKGRPLPQPAILRLRNGYWVTHVLLNEDPETAADLMLALSADLVPSLWPRASAHAMRTCGHDLGLGPVNQTLQLLGAQSSHHPEARRLLQSTRARLHRARALHQQRKYPAAITQAQNANAMLEQLFLTTRESRPDEIRALWCARPEGPVEATWDHLARSVRNAGFSTIFLYMADGVSAQYPSAVLSSTDRAGGVHRDLLGEALAAGRAHRLQIHPWIQVFHVGTTVPAEVRRELRRNGELAVQKGGGVDEHWLCPSHPRVRLRLLAAVHEMLTRYDVGGIHLDYVRYGSSRHCVCPRCRGLFERALGRPLDNWPQALEDPEVSRRWNEFRRHQVSRVVREISLGMHTRTPRPVLTAAVFSDLEISRNAVAQDWIRWCQNGWLDAVCPMNYERTTAGFADRVRKQVTALGGTRTALLPGIGATARDLTLLDIVRQVESSRGYELPGFALFQYNPWVHQTVLPALRQGLTRPP